MYLLAAMRLRCDAMRRDGCTQRGREVGGNVAKSAITGKQANSQQQQQRQRSDVPSAKKLEAPDAG
jgi:hypothetical protein